MSRLVRTPGQTDAMRPRGVSATGVVRPVKVGTGKPDYAIAGSRTVRQHVATSHDSIARIGETAMPGTCGEVDSRTVATNGKDNDRVWRHWSGSYRESAARRRMEREVSEHVMLRRVPNQRGREWFARPAQQEAAKCGKLTTE